MWVQWRRLSAALGRTAEGFETHFRTNPLGHFVLIKRLAKLLRPGARIVNLSSAGRRFSNVVLDDLVDSPNAKALWAKSEELVGERF